MHQELCQLPGNRREAIDQDRGQLHQRRFQGRSAGGGHAGIADLHQVVLLALGDNDGKLCISDDGLQEIHRNRRGPRDEELAIRFLGHFLRPLQHHREQPLHFILAAPRHEEDAFLISISVEIVHGLVKAHGWLHGVRQGMAHEIHIGPGLAVGIGFERKYGRHCLHVADDVFRPAFVPSPNGGRDVVDHRDAQLFGHVGDFHIESRIVDAHQHVGLFLQHGFLQKVTQLEEERQVL